MPSANKSETTSLHNRYGTIDGHISSITGAVIIGIITWTVVIAFSLYWNIENLREQQVNLATSEAKTNWEKDLAFRKWATQHGGVYVKPDKKTPPNPYLAHLENRDIVTSNGTKLTLMNPAYMMRQMTEDYEENYGIKGKITGKILLNPVNKADNWEWQALGKFENGANEVIATTSINGEPYLRYMRPMYMTQGCVKCHGFLGFKDGDLRGGISVSIPLAPRFSATAKLKLLMKKTHALVWLMGFIGLVSFAIFAKKRETERQELLSCLQHDALHDGLTGLANRELFTDRLTQAIQRLERDPNHQYAVCFLDLDRFKNLNDSHGHAIGDQLLIEVSKRFLQVIRPSDTVARMGGDEFTFVIEDIEGLSDAIIIAERILESLADPFIIESNTIYTNASLGICYGTPQYTYPNEILRDADIAMYRAKQTGKAKIDIFNPEMHDDAILTMQLENDLRQALQNNQLTLHYQPIVNIRDNNICGFEALLCWEHPQKGFIPPDTFIPVAEDTGQIIEIGNWVIDTACQQIQRLNREHYSENSFFVSINLSGSQILKGGLASYIKKTLETYGLDASCIHFEVTETLLIAHQQQATQTLQEIRQLGAKLSADDFGKGYSSLTYLQNFEFDVLKIDKSFVNDMSADGKGLQLVKTILRLAKDFSLSVVAEGVETQAQLDSLKQMDCLMAQGYFLCKPRPPEDLIGLLENGIYKDLDALITETTK